MLETDDRPGVRYERMDADTLKALAEADGLVFFFDPLMEAKERERVVIKAFEDLDQVTRANRAGGLDPRPTAICLTPVRSPARLRNALNP
jgi:hypothetical protein